MTDSERARAWLSTEGRDLYGSLHYDSLMKQFAAIRAEERRRCAFIARRKFPRGGAHTYASENADRYTAMEEAAEMIAEAIEHDA